MQRIENESRQRVADRADMLKTFMAGRPFKGESFRGSDDPSWERKELRVQPEVSHDGAQPLGIDVRVARRLNTLMA